jgi:hypothetical protein
VIREVVIGVLEMDDLILVLGMREEVGHDEMLSQIRGTPCGATMPPSARPVSAVVARSTATG